MPCRSEFVEIHSLPLSLLEPEEEGDQKPVKKDPRVGCGLEDLRASSWSARSWEPSWKTGGWGATGGYVGVAAGITAGAGRSGVEQSRARMLWGAGRDRDRDPGKGKGREGKGKGRGGEKKAPPIPAVGAGLGMRGGMAAKAGVPGLSSRDALTGVPLLFDPSTDLQEVQGNIWHSKRLGAVYGSREEAVRSTQIFLADCRYRRLPPSPEEWLQRRQMQLQMKGKGKGKGKEDPQAPENQKGEGKGEGKRGFSRRGYYYHIASGESAWNLQALYKATLRAKARKKREDANALVDLQEEAGQEQNPADWDQFDDEAEEALMPRLDEGTRREVQARLQQQGFGAGQPPRGESTTPRAESVGPGKPSSKLERQPEPPSARGNRMLESLQEQGKGRSALALFLAPSAANAASGVSRVAPGVPGAARMPAVSPSSEPAKDPTRPPYRQFPPQPEAAGPAPALNPLIAELAGVSDSEAGGGGQAEEGEWQDGDELFSFPNLRNAAEEAEV